jgi:crotonyl-CoA reductase
MKQGDNVLIWGATGGLGSIAIQIVHNGGGIPVGIVSSKKKAAVAKKLGCEGRQILRLKARIRRLTGGEDCDIVFEHTGRSTFAASLGVAKIGGKIVTCGSTSGYDHVFDNRYLWQTVKTIIGSHGANYHEAMLAARLICKGMLTPLLSEVFPLEKTADAISKIHAGKQVGKLGILNLAPEEGMGIRNRVLREQIGEKRINILRNN